MKTKFFLATILSLFLFSNAWASPPGGAKMDEYMKKRFVYVGNPTKTWSIDLKFVDYMVGDGSAHTVHLKSGGSESIPYSSTGQSILDNSYSFSTAFYAWVEYLKFIKANPQFHTMP